MRTEPRDLDRSTLQATLERCWGLRVAALEYLPVGFGSHHWSAVERSGARWFVTADDLEAGFQAGPDAEGSFAALDRAFRTAVHLRDRAGLEFVLAPLADAEGAVLRRMSERYALSVSPFVDGISSNRGSYESDEERRRAGGMVGRLHAATRALPAGLPRTDDLEPASRAELEEALVDLDRPWNTGPLANQARRLLRASAESVYRRLGEYDALADRVRATSASWVVTHGEPHRANVILAAEGAVYLVDWDTTLIAPHERDLRMVLGEDLAGWDEYVAAAGPVSLNRETIDLYRRAWDLSEIGIFVRLFRRPHEETEDTVYSFESLAEYL